MATALWTPLTSGIRASIYNPGGPDGATCDLATLTPIALATQIFLDNFTGTNGADLVAHTDDTGIGLWEHELAGDLVLLDGSVVNAVASTPTTYTSATVSLPGDYESTLQADFAAFDTTDFTVTVEARGFTNTLSIVISCVAEVITASASIAGYQNNETATITVPYCTWSSLIAYWNPETGTLRITLGAATAEVVLGGSDSIDLTRMAVSINNATANAARIAAVSFSTIPF